MFGKSVDCESNPADNKARINDKVTALILLTTLLRPICG